MRHPCRRFHAARGWSSFDGAHLDVARWCGQHVVSRPVVPVGRNCAPWQSVRTRSLGAVAAARRRDFDFPFARESHYFGSASSGLFSARSAV